MRRRRNRTPMAAMDQINVTPLLDLTFLLLIAFMITMPLMEYGTNAAQPPEMNSEKLPEENFISVCKDFAAELQSITGIPVVLYDERLTTVTAHSFLSMSGLDSRQHKKHVDELSARLILEDYMKMKKNREEQNG